MNIAEMSIHKTLHQEQQSLKELANFIHQVIFIDEGNCYKAGSALQYSNDHRSCLKFGKYIKSSELFLFAGLLLRKMLEYVPLMQRR